MNKNRGIFSITMLLLVVIVLAGAMAPGASADESETIAVSFRVEGIRDSIYYNQSVGIAEGATVADLLEQIGSTEGAPKITISSSAYGAYVSAINDLAEFGHGVMSGWSYRVNGADPSVGISQCALKDRDSVVWFYGDPYGAGMQYPEVDWSMLHSDSVIRFTSKDAVYSDIWTMSLVENPVAGAKVTFRWDTYTTNEKGEITIMDKTGVSGYRALQVERYDELTGVPTVLRFAPDYKIYVPFADTPQGDTPAWYEDALRFCVREEYFFGTDPTANLIEPLRKMTMMQLVTVLARIGGVDPDSTTGEHWYMVPISWAISNGVLPAGEGAMAEEAADIYKQMSGKNVTREEFIHMFYRTVGLVEGYDMDVRADITSASDYSDIKAGYREAISWALASGIISGTNPDSLIISPAVEVNRAMVCQMIFNYYN